MVELHECSSEILDDIIKVEEVMVAAAEAAGATVVEAHFHEFKPIGVSGFVVITESHLAIHTWPEHRYAAVDIFTCGQVVEPERAAQELIDKFQSKSPTMFEVKRGFVLPPDNAMPPQ
jgi:S-adenosylmethionine decarboxylase